MPPVVDPMLRTRAERQLREVRDHLERAERRERRAIEAVHPDHRASAVNLVHYVELRRHDIRALQLDLASLGLSSLGRAESAVMRTIDTVLEVLAMLDGRTTAGNATTEPADGSASLTRNAQRLLGPSPAGRRTRVMVTMPAEAATDAELVDRLVRAGMDVARINTAHDDLRTWSQMHQRVRDAAARHGRSVTVAYDLAGPKLRTGALRPGPPVMRIRPARDAFGRVVSPARLLLTGSTSPEVAPPGDVVVVPVQDGRWPGRRRVGEEIRVVDTRGASRRWRVVETGAAGCLVTAERTAYLSTDLHLEVDGADDETAIADLAPIPAAHRVARGDTVVVRASSEPGLPTGPGEEHVIGCSLPEVLAHVRVGERMSFDDGKLGGIVRRVDVGEAHVEITEARSHVVKLRGEKGINLPDTDLPTAALTDADVAVLDVVAARADLVSLSFVRRPDDVLRLQDELVARDAGDTGIVLKIENAAAFERLPELLLVAMRSRRLGVMIARGDLAVEIGFTRMAEVQEEILWLCEAAHVPVIWATQVLDTLARTGQASRAEITDAAMGDRAECVMLNKGPYITDAIEVLHSILARMQEHQQKKRSLLRRLRSWDREPIG
ncbi:MAG: pyruvate kinase [Ilumatobacteraceae bacterium]|nr:hypothetical protein [Acidimicrobiales bacterium]MCB9392361.1 pyruvate kinase [Acidimicrobiaceae bacterium]